MVSLSLKFPLMGAGGSGRRLRVDNQDEDLFWIQEEATSKGHTVPLTSMSLVARPSMSVTLNALRLYERSVLR
jgi:hypothetical protein